MTERCFSYFSLLSTYVVLCCRRLTEKEKTTKNNRIIRRFVHNVSHFLYFSCWENVCQNCSLLLLACSEGKIVKVKREKTKYIRTVVVPNTRRVGHVDVVVVKNVPMYGWMW